MNHSPRKDNTAVSLRVLLTDDQDDVESEFMKQKKLVQDLMDILNLQGPTIDPRFLETVKSKLSGARVLRDAFHTVQNGRKAQPTWAYSSTLTWGAKLRPS